MKLLLLAALVAAPVGSLAQTSSSAREVFGVLVVGEPPDGPSAELADLAGALRAAIAARSPGVLTADEVRRRMAGNGQGATLTELDRAFAGAVAAYQSGDYEGSARTLRAVVDDLDNMPESDDAYAAWTRALLRLARAEGSLGRKGEAREVMERLLRSNPGARADPELYPPSFGKQLDEVRAALRAAPQRKLQINATGKNARVFVEGRSAGNAPLSASLPPGRYRISGQLGDVRVNAGVVDLTQEDQVVSIDFSVANTFRPAAGPGLAIPSSSRSRGVITAAASLKLDRVATAALEKDGDVRYVVGGLFDIRRGILEREGRVRLSGSVAPAGGMEALAGFLLTGQSSGLVITKLEKGEAPAPEKIRLELPEEPRPYKGTPLKRWSPVAAGGAAIVLGGVAIWQGVVSDSKYTDANALTASGSIAPANVDKFNALVRDGDVARGVAIGTGIGAAACAITSGVLGWLSYKATGEIGPFRF